MVESLRVLTGTGGGPLDAILGSLMRKELLVLNGDPRSPERGQYKFLQGLLREVAHETLSKRERRERHLAVARYLEGLADDELFGVVASHYLDAFRATSAGAEADALAAQARSALRAAADRASALHSHDQAFGYLEQALMVTTDDSDRAAILERAAGSAVAIGKDHVAEDYLTRAMARYQEIDDLYGVARAATALAQLLTTSGHSKRAIALLESVRLPDRDTDPAFVALNAELARAFMIHFDSSLAVQYADRALMAASQPDLVPVVVEALITKGCALAQKGHHFREAQAVLAGAMWLAQRHALVLSEIRARGNLAVFLSLDDPRQALELTRTGFDLATRLGHLTLTKRLGSDAAWYAFRTGDWDWALGLLDELEAESGDSFISLQILAVYRANRGDGPAAERLLSRADQLVRGSTNPELAEGIATTRAFVGVASGQMREAYEKAIGSAKTMNNSAFRGQTLDEACHAALALKDVKRMRAAVRDLEAMGNRGKWLDACKQEHRAGLALLEGRIDEGLAAYRIALARWRELGMVRDLGYCLIDIASLLGTDHPQGRAAADEAREIFTRLKAAPILERLEALSVRVAVAR